MIQMQGIHKAFGKNKVLLGVDFTLHDGSIHALMGENGAGKSTLMKILSGVHQYDSGEILRDGEAVQYNTLKEAEKAGVIFIHQELNIWPELTVLENLFIGNEKTKFGLLNNKLMKEQGEAVFKRLKFKIDLSKRAGDCSVGQQQMIEIAKALMMDTKVLIMDEPTAALTDSEIEVLFDIINDLRASGVSIVYISHRMDEIFTISDEITVLRDGMSVLYEKTEHTDYNALVRAMVGRDLDEQFPTRSHTVESDIALKVEGLENKTHNIKDISFELRKGEILGFAGLMGAGRTEIMRALFGADPGAKNVAIHGKQVKIDKPSDAINHGIGFITENRKSEGLILDFNLIDNLTMPSHKSFSSKGFMKRKDEADFADLMIKRLNIKTEKSSLMSQLSGGNQQKVVIGKWVGRQPEILILDEPTRGIDVGAKREIYYLINELTERGMSIVLISSELPEVIGLSDRVAVMSEGRLMDVLDKEQVNQENIMTLATGGKLDETETYSK
ncbi:sugar ABC transporter ATP-binding protein [Salinicoccus sesuvii]|uniref:Sugar ABC transporter ATP-binding protein n=1 Tax=Salinicoccus sesuvii TaxID=868281 RepID=A0ABV7N879_9STAP